ncbi:MAG TPA: two-component regulator propeller domain-containing protein [Nitrospiria bacterium]|nr:two-component regulator propeller domain-containing protein [Nitrospiria bacterium]
MKSYHQAFILSGLIATVFCFALSSQGETPPPNIGRLIKVSTANYNPPPPPHGGQEGKGVKTVSGEFRPSTLYPELWTSWAIGALVRALAVDPRHLWVGTTNGVIRYNRQDESQTVYTTKDGLLSNIILTINPDLKSQSSAPSGSGGRSSGLTGSGSGVWIGTYGGGLSHFDGASWKTYTPYGGGVTASYGADWQPYQPGQGLGDLWVYDLAFDPRGTLWIATWKGVSRFDGKAFKTYKTEDGLVDAWVYTLSLDPKGYFWFGTEGGVTFYNRQRWKSWTHKDGLGATLPQEKEAVQAYPLPIPHHQEQSKQVQSYNPNYVISSVVDRQGNAWFGTWGAGLSRFDGKHWKNYTSHDGLSGNVINSLAIDRDGVLWIGTNGGVSRYAQRGFINYSKETGLLADTIYAIAIDDQNNKWFGTLGGLTRYTGP